VAEEVTTYNLFGGRVRTMNTVLGINQTPTVITTNIIKDDQPISVVNRQVVDISVGELVFRGLVQSWSETKVDVAGTGVYQVRITDTKPVLNSAQIVVGASYNDAHTQAYNYGDNVIPVVFSNASQISNGIPFNTIKSKIESSSIKYGPNVFTVKLNFTLPNRGSLIEYSVKGRAMSLLEFISQIADDHGLDWYVTTSTSNVITVNMFGRSNITNVTLNQLANLHNNEVIRRHEGKENRDATQKVVLIGGFRSYLHETDGLAWQQFWGFDSNGNKRSVPVYSEAIMEQVINNNFTEDDFTEEDVQKILSYANEYWGRKFIGLITPPSTIGSDGRSWVVPTSSAWYESNEIPLEFNRDGQLKFQTEDGRWITFATLPFPGTRIVTGGTNLTYQWDDELFSNPNTFIDEDREISIKASVEIIDGFTELEYWMEQFIVYLLNQDVFPGVTVSLALFFIENPDISLTVRFDLIRLATLFSSTLEDIANGDLFYTDAVKNTFKENFRDQYFVMTLATPLRIKKIETTTTTNEDTGALETGEKITKRRLSKIAKGFVALLDQRETYGPWSNRNLSIGKTDVVIDPSLTPWAFGFRGIINSTGMDQLEQVARAKIKTVADTTLDAKTAELEVPGTPKVNIGDQLQTTGVITNISVSFGIQGVKTTYQAMQYTNELSRFARQQRDLIDRLRRQAAEFNNTLRPPQDDWTLDSSLRNLRHGLPEPSLDSSKEGNRLQSGQLLGRVAARSSNTEPKYTITPMAWVSDAFGELSLVRDPKVLDQYFRVVNMGEKQTAPGRLPIGTDVQVNKFTTTDGGVSSYYIDVAAPKPPTFTATITGFASNAEPRYVVVPTTNVVQEINLLPSELNALNSVLNIGEPANFKGYLSIDQEVTVFWNENSNGSYTPFLEQQLNLFKPIE